VSDVPHLKNQDREHIIFSESVDYGDMAYIQKEKILQEILELFENQLSLLIRMDKLEKMKIRKRIRDVVLLTLGMDIRHPKIFMNIMEDKLQDVFDLFHDGLEFKKKLAREIDQKFKMK
jgi:hypothetical protein